MVVDDATIDALFDQKAKQHSQYSGAVYSCATLIHFCPYAPAIRQPKMKRCVVGIGSRDAPDKLGRGQFKATVWFPSMATMAAVLSEDNRTLLRIIRERQPKSLTERAELTGRQVPNLSRTLRMMEGYGLVSMAKNARETQPTALATDFLVVLD